MLKESNYCQRLRRWSAPGKLAKIKAKMATSFVQGRISSSQDPNHSVMDFNKRLGSCSLVKDCSPAPLRNHCKEVICHFHARAHYTDLDDVDGGNIIDANSRILEDIEVQSDREELCFNTTSSISSDDEEGESEQGCDSLRSETELGQLDNQQDALEDIRALFNVNQESATDMEENGSGGLAVDLFLERIADEDEVVEERGQQAVENDMEWVDIENIAENLGFRLVPKCKEVNSLSTRKKGGKRELQNLKFEVKFKDSELTRGTYNSK